MIEYRKFCHAVDEDSIMPCLNRSPLKDAMRMAQEEKRKGPPKHVFINFKDRQRVSVVCKKLSNFITLGNIDYFRVSILNIFKNHGRQSLRVHAYPM